MQLRGNPYKCYYCGKDEVCTKDHFFPKSLARSGSKEIIKRLYPGVPQVLVYACKRCQRTKAAYLPHEFLDRIKGKKIYTDAEIVRINTAIKSLIKLLKKHGAE